jgi:GTPase
MATAPSEEPRPEASKAVAPQAATRCGFVAIIGAPNAGKSTLVNALVGSKVSIVTHKVQTTRSLVRGIAMIGASQAVLIDTPGIFKPKRRLERAMVEAAWAGAGDADRVLFIIDCQKGIEDSNARILERLAAMTAPRVLVVNKIDRVRKDELLALTGALNAQVPFERTFMISALNGSGVDDLKAYLGETMPPGPWHYPEDEVSDVPMRSLAAEITREKLFLRLHEELPYQSTVATTAWQEQKDGSARIEQTIFVERDSQRKIVLGKGGSAIKAISMEARKELAQILERPVHLFLFVKVSDSWSEDSARYAEFGLNLPGGQ